MEFKRIKTVAQGTVGNRSGVNQVGSNVKSKEGVGSKLQGGDRGTSLLTATTPTNHNNGHLKPSLALCCR